MGRTATRAIRSVICSVMCVVRGGAAFVVVVGVLVGVVAGCPGDPPLRTAPKTDYALYLTRYPFGGQTLEWWQQRITELSPGGKSPDPALRALTVARAEKNGLVVGDDGVVKVGPELTTRIMGRLEAEEAPK